LFGTVLWLLGEWMSLSTTTTEIKKVDEQLDLYGEQYNNVLMLEQKQAEVTKKRQEIEVVLEPFLPLQYFLSEIITPLPDRVWISSLNIDPNSHVELQGKSDRMRAVALYMMDIESSPSFANASLETIDNKDAKGLGDIFDFKLVFDMSKAGLKK
jgi:Tfp pilus assembly protein PilN